MGFTVAALIVGLAISVATGSAATLGYALENGVDSFSSGLVLWRFWGGGASVSEEVLETREKRASIGIAFAFIALAFTVGSVAAVHLHHSEEPEEVSKLVALAAPSVVICALLGIFKYRVGSLVDSPSLKKDGICSLCGAGLSLGVLVGGSLLLNDVDGSWWLDGAIAVSVSVGLLGYGVFTLVKNAEMRWWKADFWSTPTSRRANTAGLAAKVEMSPGLQESEINNPL